MGDILFARPDYHYDSYLDLYRLIELSGFRLIRFSEIDPASDNCYIMTMVNGENQHGWEAPRARIILWDLEWRDKRPAIPGVSDIWASDAWYAQMHRMTYVPMGSHPGLADWTEMPDEFERGGYLRYVYDAAYLAYMIPRREALWTQLNARRVRLSPRSAWNGERSFVLRKSKLYLHVHQHDAFPCIPSLRLVMAAAYHLPFKTEACHDYGHWQDVVMHTPYDGIVPSLIDDIDDRCAGQREAFGNALHYAACHDWTFRRAVESAV